MEATEHAKVLDPPLAALVGLQFGLATASDIVKFSVFEKGESLQKAKDLLDPRLGVPTEDGRCATCGGNNYEACTGHFAHVKLAQGIFHPNHMRLLQRILGKICLGCGNVLANKKTSPFQESSATEGATQVKPKRIDKRTQDHSSPSPGHNVVGTANGIHAWTNAPQASPIFDEEHTNEVIVLSSDDEESLFPSGILRVVQPQGRKRGPFAEETSTSVSLESPRRRSLRTILRQGKAANKGPLPSATKPVVEKAYMATPAKVSHHSGSGSSGRSNPKRCRYCTGGKSEYPHVKLKLVPAKGPKIGDKSLIIQMEIASTVEGIASDYWAFVEGTSSNHFDYQVPRERILLPSEALRILKKIPEEAMLSLGMHKVVARPEALVMECVPVPPNCTRAADLKYVNNTTAVRFGVDRVTRSLHTLIEEILRIKSTRTGKPMFKASKDETRLLQTLTAEYLREKGAPKAVPGKDPKKLDRNGRVMKGNDYRWTKDWLTQNILGKSGNYAARAVITGDPFIKVEEIAIPYEIAQTLTIPERVTSWNCQRLQKYVDRTQSQELSRGTGVVRIVRDGQVFHLWPTSTHQLEIGDIVHRHLRNGDLVYANRPPSVHAHSLMALQVVLHSDIVMAINPMICAPYNADFDGDIFHLFVPQSLEAMAELQELMTVQQQMISSQGGQPLLGLTQDTLLAAALITSTNVLLDKPLVQQLAMWTSVPLPEATIVKSPKGGPFWTGVQMYGLTLPAGLDFESADDKVLIRNGEILKCSDAKWLQRGNDSVIAALCDQLGPRGALEHLNSAKGLLHTWLSLQGFSAGLPDFLVTLDSQQRQNMLRAVNIECLERAMYQAVDLVQNCDAQSSMKVDSDQCFGRSVFDLTSFTKKVTNVEDSIIKAFQASAAHIEDILSNTMQVGGNSLLDMARSGSKGSMRKLVEQCACMGLQLYKGEHLLPFARVQHEAKGESQLQEWWEAHGFVQGSLVDGLRTLELFNHTIANRTGILRKHVEVIQPGTLFKALMLFLRDLHIGYDGTVRSQCGQNIVQFCYGGAETSATMEEGGSDSVQGVPWSQSKLAGEAVGVLAATAISQPAYELMLDAPHLSGSFKLRPLELVQETLNPRDKSDSKLVDQRVMIKLALCDCLKPWCHEKRVLEVQDHLRKIPLKMLVQSSSIEFWNMENLNVGGSGALMRLGSPWLGHIQLSRDKLLQHKLTMEEILCRLRKKFSTIMRITKKNPLGQIFFGHSDECGPSKGACIHFSPKLPLKMQYQSDDEEYNNLLLELMEKMRDKMLPSLLECTVRGDSRIKSVRIVGEDNTWPSWHPRAGNKMDEELVLEVVVASKLKTKRGTAWSAVKEACLPIMEQLDWKRSMPYSIQEIKHALGVEVAYQMVVQRLGLAIEKTGRDVYKEHLKLVADMMTFSGDANGFTFAGFQDMIKSARVSAPFTEASYQKPIRRFMDAAGKGATDSLEGVMAACVWGKEAPLGTGVKIDLHWQHPQDSDDPVCSLLTAPTDVHTILKELSSKCIPDFPVPVSPVRSIPEEPEPGLICVGDEGTFSPPHGGITTEDWKEVGDRGTGGGGWGDDPCENSGQQDGGWQEGAVQDSAGSGWANVHQNTEKQEDGWGAVAGGSGGPNTAGVADPWSEGGTGGGGWGDDPCKNSGQQDGGWQEGAVQDSAGSGWANVHQNTEKQEDGWGAVAGGSGGPNTAGVADPWSEGNVVSSDTGWGSVTNSAPSKKVGENQQGGSRPCITTSRTPWSSRGGQDIGGSGWNNACENRDGGWQEGAVQDTIGSGWAKAHQDTENEGEGWGAVAGRSGGPNTAGEAENDTSWSKPIWKARTETENQSGGWGREVAAVANTRSKENVVSGWDSVTNSVPEVEKQQGGSRPCMPTSRTPCNTRADHQVEATSGWGVTEQEGGWGAEQQSGGWSKAAASTDQAVQDGWDAMNAPSTGDDRICRELNRDWNVAGVPPPRPGGSISAADTAQVLSTNADPWSKTPSADEHNQGSGWDALPEPGKDLKAQKTQSAWPMQMGTDDVEAEDATSGPQGSREGEDWPSQRAGHGGFQRAGRGGFQRAGRGGLQRDRRGPTERPVTGANLVPLGKRQPPIAGGDGGEVGKGMQPTREATWVGGNRANNPWSLQTGANETSAEDDLIENLGPEGTRGKGWSSPETEVRSLPLEVGQAGRPLSGANLGPLGGPLPERAGGSDEVLTDSTKNVNGGWLNTGDSTAHSPECAWTNEGEVQNTGWDAFPSSPIHSVAVNIGWDAIPCSPIHPTADIKMSESAVKMQKKSSGGWASSDATPSSNWDHARPETAEGCGRSESGTHATTHSNTTVNDEHNPSGGWSASNTAMDPNWGPSGTEIDKNCGWPVMEANDEVSAMPSQGLTGMDRPRREPECKEIDHLVKTMRSILHNRSYEDGARLAPLDDKVVQEVVVHHPKYMEKLGCGIAYIKVDKHPDFAENRCFWIVRTDDSQSDFSYHKCLKGKVAKDFPWFVDRYDTIYTGRPRGPG